MKKIFLFVFLSVVFSFQQISFAEDKTSQLLMQVAQTFLGGGNQQGTGGRNAQGALLIYGDRNKDIYLGCLNCSQYDRDSVTNPRSPFASTRARTSIYNLNGPFGSQNSDYSACNRFAQDPPIVVDENGNRYGTLTLNNFHRDAIQDREVVSWLVNTVCGANDSNDPFQQQRGSFF